MSELSTPLADSPDDATTETSSTDEATTDASTRLSAPDAVAEVGLHRSNTNRVVAGVAGGLGDRFEIDPNIVRVIFVVLTVLYGLGAAIYLAMWVLIPRSSIGRDVVAAEKLPFSRSRWMFYALAAGVVVLAAIVIATTAGAPHVGSGLAILWLIFLVVIAVLALRTPVSRLNFRRVLAVAFLLGVSTLILLVGAFVALLASTGVPIAGSNGSRVWQPTTITQVSHAYRVRFGSGLVNLSSVTFPREGYTVSASVAVGNLTVVFPADAVVDLRTQVGVGGVENAQQYPDVDGYFVPAFSAVPTNLRTPAAIAAAPHVTVDAQVGVGRIYIDRAQPTRRVTPR